MRLFGVLPRYVPGYNYADGIAVEVQEGTTYQRLSALLRLPECEVGFFSVGGIIKKADDVVSGGEEVSIFMHLGGG